MSGTRSPSRKAPATEALIVAHGQPSNPNLGEAALAMVAHRVQARLPGWRVQSATLAAPGALEAALKRQAQPGLVYPLFMADGWFVRTALPGRLVSSAGAQVLAPLGLDPALPELAAKILRDAGSAPVLIAAHGSARTAWAAAAAMAFSDALAKLMPETTVATGFVEQAPSIASAAATLQGSGLCLPFFALGGGHVTDDVPQMLQMGGFRGEILAPLGEQNATARLIAASLLQNIQERVTA